MLFLRPKIQQFPMTETYKFIDLIKNILVVCCLLATLSATCRQEQTRDRIDAKIDALLSAELEPKGNQ